MAILIRRGIIPPVAIGVGPPAMPPSTALWGWWDATESYVESDGVTFATKITTDGTAIGSWKEISGGGHHMLQGNSGKKPLYKTAILNGLPAARFDGIDDFLQSLGGPTGNSFSMYAVAQYTANTNLGAIITQDDGSINPRYALLDNGSGSIEVYNGGTGATQAMSTSDYHLVAGTVDNTASFQTTLQIDNAVITMANATGLGNDGGFIDIGGLAVFSKFWTGDILEVLIYTALHDLSSGDGLLTRQYLNGKFNLALGI